MPLFKPLPRVVQNLVPLGRENVTTPPVSKLCLVQSPGIRIGMLVSTWTSWSIVEIVFARTFWCLHPLYAHLHMTTVICGREQANSLTIYQYRLLVIARAFLIKANRQNLTIQEGNRSCCMVVRFVQVKTGYSKPNTYYLFYGKKWHLYKDYFTKDQPVIILKSVVASHDWHIIIVYQYCNDIRDAVCHFLRKRIHRAPPMEYLLESLELILSNNYLRFEWQFYLQKKGTVMDSFVVSSFATYLLAFWRKLLFINPFFSAGQFMEPFKSTISLLYGQNLKIFVRIYYVQTQVFTKWGNISWRQGGGKRRTFDNQDLFKTKWS